jgi:hypothetical protein
MSDAEDYRMSDVCDVCFRRVRIFYPRDSDGSKLEYASHRNEQSERCDGSRREARACDAEASR